MAALRQTAHMVAVMEQDVLMQAFGESQVGCCMHWHGRCFSSGQWQQ